MLEHEPKRRLAEDVGAPDEIAADESALTEALSVQKETGAKLRGVPINGAVAAQPSQGLRVAVAVEPNAAPVPASEPFKRYDNQPFSHEAEMELEKSVAAFRADLVKKSIRAKNEVRGDVVSAYNVKMASAGPMRRAQPLSVKLAGMSGNAVLGAAFGALVSLLVAPPPEGLKPGTIGLLVALVTLGTIGVAWQLMRED